MGTAESVEADLRAEIQQMKTSIADIIKRNRSVIRELDVKNVKALQEIELKNLEIERLRAELRIAYRAFSESNIKQSYEAMHQADIEEHNRMMHEIAVLKYLLTRGIDALSLSHQVFDKECGICVLIQELRKAL